MLRFFTFIIGCILLTLSLHSCKKLQNFIPEDLAREAIVQTLMYSADTADEQSQDDASMNSSAATKIMFPQSELLESNILDRFPTGLNALNSVNTKINQESNKLSKDLNIFIDDAIVELAIDNAYELINSDDALATKYLNEEKSAQLKRDFTTYLAQKINGSDLEKAILEFQNTYNSLNGSEVLTQDVASYIAEKIIDRYFYLMSLEEVKIRTDKSHQRTDVLQQVFGDN